MLIPSVNTNYLHFVGIGGIGMSGIAEVLHNLGYKVMGSDLKENNNITRLRSKGIKISIGHHSKHVEGAQVVIISSAVQSDNPEVIQARLKGIPVIMRAEMLAEIMRLRKSIAISGTHGKTTTTSLMAALLDQAGFDPTVVNGGVINAYNTNARLGMGEWAVVEADESDGSFMKLPATVAVITNIDAEHMEYYKDFETLKQAFIKFIHNIPFYGAGVLCIDHPVVKELLGQVTDRRLITYGLNEDAMVRGVNLRFNQQGAVFDVEISLPYQSSTQNMQKKMIHDIFLPLMGEHNVTNALSVVAVAQELKIEDRLLIEAFANFKGVKRRFTLVGEFKGARIIDDYAHHPVEIINVIKAARQSTSGRVIVVAQPHRYSRLHSLFAEFSKCFSNADELILTPVYSAGEAPLPSITSSNLAQTIREYTGQKVLEILNADELAPLLFDIIQENDIVLCLGAGSITYWAQDLSSQLKAIERSSIHSTI